jgi:hypothetical protein
MSDASPAWPAPRCARRRHRGDVELPVARAVAGDSLRLVDERTSPVAAYRVGTEAKKTKPTSDLTHVRAASASGRLAVYCRVASCAAPGRWASLMPCPSTRTLRCAVLDRRGSGTVRSTSSGLRTSGAGDVTFRSIRPGLEGTSLEFLGARVAGPDRFVPGKSEFGSILVEDGYPPDTSRLGPGAEFAGFQARTTRAEGHRATSCSSATG